MPLPPTRPRLRERYDRRRDEVISAAARVFAKQGFHATSVQDLTEATDLTAGGLYHYIGSKDRLLVQICSDLMEPLLGQAHAIVAEDAPAEEQLRGLVRAWVVHVERYRYHMLVFQQERHVLQRGAQWKQVREQRKQFEQILADVLERGERDGAYHLPDRDLALRALLGMVNHTPQWFNPRGRLGAEQIADGYLEILTRRDH